MKSFDKIQIRPIKKNEWDDAMALAWRTFLKFDASDYSEVGVESFKDFITDQTLHRMFEMGVYRVYGAFSDDSIVGMISLRNEIMISLLFVDGSFHYEGIGKALVDYLKRNVVMEEGHTRMVVNAAPYALDFYYHLGFKAIGDLTENEGISYTPMELMFQ